MATIERQIDALGGAQEGVGEYNAGYHDGFSRALYEAMKIGADADALVEELLETIEDLLEARRGLVWWTKDAVKLVERVRTRRAA